ncbi:MAG: metallophosphoesterase family protein [Beijerinckiaceae bacterium]
MAAFRFVHTADIHLDSPLRSLAMRDPALAGLVGDATRAAFTRIVDLCLEEQVDALLIAGDLYDGDQTSMKTARFIGEAFRRLADAGIRVFVIRGNHDHLARITRELTFPDGVHVFGGRAGCEVIARRSGQPVAIHGLSFASDKATESLLPKYGKPKPDTVNIGLMHTSLGGSPGHSTYAPCTVADLQASGFRYWALGHIHKRSVVEGAATIVMPGMPQGRDINEDGPKSVTLATVADDGSLALEERVVGAAVFRRVSVDISDVEEMRDVLRRAARGLEAFRAAGPSAQVIARVGLMGRTPLARRIRRDLDRVREDIALEVGAGRGLWIEAVESDAREPEAVMPAAGALAELARLATSEVLPAEGFRRMAQEIADEFVRRHLPNDERLRGMLGDDEVSAAAAVAKLAEQGVGDVLARLLADDAGEAG